MSDRGFSLVELVVAAGLVLVVASALFGLSRGLQRAFDGSSATIDVTTRARSAVMMLSSDLRDAGSGVAIGPALQSLGDVMPVVIPRRSLDDPSIVSPFGAITIVRASGAQGVLRDAALAGTSMLQLDAAAPSTRQDGTAGLRSGDAAVVVDAHRAEAVTIAAVNAPGWALTLAAPLRSPFLPGALVIGIERNAYGLRADSAGVTRLLRSSASSVQPLVDHVPEFDVRLWGTAEPPLLTGPPDWFPTYGPLPPPLAADDEREAWPAGENCTFALGVPGARAARLAQRAPAGALVALDAAALSDGPWCPDAGDPESFDADLLRLRRVDVRIRVDLSPDDRNLAREPMAFALSSAFRQR